MARSPSEKQLGLPETALDHLLGRLRRHALWDLLLIFIPPLFAVFYIAIYLYHSPLISREAAILACGAILAAALLGGIWRHRGRVPSALLAARRIDDKVEGKDRFITLATIEAALSPSSLVARLRREAAALLHRMDLKRDFPYKIKRSCFISSTGALAGVLLFHLFLPNTLAPTPRPSPVRELAQLAQRLKQVPRFSALAPSLEALVARLQDKSLSGMEKHALVQDLLKKMEEQLNLEEQEGGTGSDLMRQATDALRRAERQIDKGEGKDQEKSGGELKTNLPKEGKGGKKESAQGKDGEGEGEASAAKSQGPQGGGAEKKEKGTGKGEGKGDQVRGEKPEKEREKSGETQGMAKQEREGKGGKGKTGEEIPKGTAPERFLQQGEQGEKGIKGTRFVTVQLPEEEAGSQAAGEGGPGKRRNLRPKVPISNVPLKQPDAPNTAPEKQPLPLEYRRLIR